MELPEPQSITEALQLLADLEGTQSICSRFHQLLNTIELFARTHPDHRAMCNLITDRVLVQHQAYHLVIEGIANEASRARETP
jgi:hypothetical protein